MATDLACCGAPSPAAGRLTPRQRERRFDRDKEILGFNGGARLAIGTRPLQTVGAKS